MSEIRRLEKNVSTFLNQASAAYGQIKADEFSQKTYIDLIGARDDSPIEDLFHIALILQCAAFYIDLNPSVSDYENDEFSINPKLTCKTQEKIGKYKVDFLLIHEKTDNQPLVVELDGHDFHDKDKLQRSYEKARDRFLIKEGYKVIHFTGSDVCADPHKVVFESLSMIGIPAYQVESLEELDPNNTLMRTF
ncbi:DUF559 domain-containing protein [Nitrosomonas sp.]|uniref:endonuclease domain-containing protein n=1 Tax=Nitrosomonas sp. TaxID=42353 RepID=UPI00248EEA84|nr:MULTISPECIES: DUF559 domain-containing protein [Nitrosomonas]MCW5600428.1 DUF559 domain-containing protein [Nitrosomonas sp.]